MIQKIILIFLISFTSYSNSKVEEIIIAQELDTEEVNVYFHKLLHMALTKTISDYGDYKIKKVYGIKQNRVLDLIKKGIVDIFFTMTSKEREAQTLPIRVPLLKGLLGVRVCLLRNAKEHIFAEIQTLNQFKKMNFSIGQGYDWPDTEILRANGLKVVTGPSHKSLFKMLIRDRFDCYSRGVTEALIEIKTFKQYSMQIDPYLLFRYKSPMYFFVSKKNTKLAKRIEKGLLTAIEDGDFEKLFHKHHGQHLKNYKSRSRRVFDLKNPLLPVKTPIHNKKLWLEL
ncbi:hypothetical protein A9Q84_18750 [Halobacteriovorax marinus]|uniref:Uncharacterized protein n=1 Tax=Halobacteriovorax marinus TaxID=97084 RepID=A0A1Y5F2Q9_9BACT|nr:hypothetical protein A9Q84_18750 [Halobacteriovorax marinus]